MLDLAKGNSCSIMAPDSIPLGSTGAVRAWRRFLRVRGSGHGHWRSAFAMVWHGIKKRRLGRMLSPKDDRVLTADRDSQTTRAWDFAPMNAH
jgi:hypothetical protein